MALPSDWPLADPKTASFSLPGGTGAASIARRSVISLEAGLPLGVRHRVALMLSELVANAVQHGGQSVHGREPMLMDPLGAMAEWLRSGLQSRLHRFDSGRRLRSRESALRRT